MTKDSSRHESIYCISCGASLREHMESGREIAFCPYCGEKQTGDASEVDTHRTEKVSVGKKWSFSAMIGVAGAIALIIGTVSFSIMRSLIPEPKPQPPAQEQPQNSSVNAEQQQEMLVRLKDSLDKNPNNPHALLALANAMYDGNMFVEAAKLYERYLTKFDSTNVDARIDYAFTLFQQGMADEALRQTKHAMDFAPNNPVAMFNIGIIYYQQKQYDQARDWLTKAIAAAPNTAVSEKAQEILKTLPVSN